MQPWAWQRKNCRGGRQLRLRKDVNAGREKDAATPVRLRVAIAHGGDRRLNRSCVVGHPVALGSESSHIHAWPWASYGFVSQYAQCGRRKRPWIEVGRRQRTADRRIPCHVQVPT